MIIRRFIETGMRDSHKKAQKGQTDFMCFFVAIALRQSLF